MDLKTNRNSHALYNLEYHLVLVTKYRKPCITGDVFRTLDGQVRRVAAMYGMEVEESAYESDHVHVLLSAPPQVNLAQVVNAIKSTSSRIVRKEHAAHLARYYWKPYFWSRSYLILSSGGAPVDVIRRYIREQGTEKHAAKKAGREQAERKRKRAADST